MAKGLRMRVFAGPNGSGKSTMYRRVRDHEVNGRKVDLGVYVNPDDVARTLRVQGVLDLRDYELGYSRAAGFVAFLRRCTLVPTRISMKDARAALGWEGSRVQLKDAAKHRSRSPVAHPVHL